MRKGLITRAKLLKYGARFLLLMAVLRYTLAYIKAFKKHRELLGEEAYNDRVANQILSQIGKKNNKLGWIALSLREAGLIATSKVILNKDRIRKKLGR